jgi:hypothetical protein
MSAATDQAFKNPAQCIRVYAIHDKGEIENIVHTHNVERKEIMGWRIFFFVKDTKFVCILRQLHVRPTKSTL